MAIGLGEFRCSQMRCYSDFYIILHRCIYSWLGHEWHVFEYTSLSKIERPSIIQYYMLHFSCNNIVRKLFIWFFVHKSCCFKKQRIHIHRYSPISIFFLTLYLYVMDLRVFSLFRCLRQHLWSTSRKFFMQRWLSTFLDPTMNAIKPNISRW